jgi:hypothetical protein
MTLDEYVGPMCPIVTHNMMTAIIDSAIRIIDTATELSSREHEPLPYTE